jgi:hypothetical protein
MPIGDISRLHCNTCGLPTNHRTLQEETRKYDEVIDADRGAEVWGEDKYLIVMCCGCERVHFTHESWFSEDIDEYGNHRLAKYRYPPALPRRQPQWFGGIFNELLNPLPEDIHQFLLEIYNTLENGNFRLCGLGIRALLEQIMVIAVGDRGSLGQNIAAFFEAGYVAPQQHQLFREKLIEVGNAAMHRGYRPNRSEIDTLLDITENLVESIYVHPVRAKHVGANIPPRKSR